MSEVVQRDEPAPEQKESLQNKGKKGQSRGGKQRRVRRVEAAKRIAASENAPPPLSVVGLPPEAYEEELPEHLPLTGYDTSKNNHHLLFTGFIRPKTK